ncbi:hypothetical protein [Saccharothrix obliqua]|uniref:hypothetical protein n=1 Tax=Saccharothrix obliqua TaxID=2861747 RepID=UPI001C5F8F57|nr:hypothetical protein [Saccharothrix obliqua]MBW4722318.1 hypothetical protein [Saccharothrix obliqua]
MSQPIEVRQTHADLRRSLGGSIVPQTVLRIGFGHPTPPSPRRDITDLLPEPDPSRT